MNTQYAKQKIEKLMAIVNHPTTNPNEASSAREMARKVAEKYGVLTWFFLTYINNKQEKQVVNFDYYLNEKFRWIDITNTLFNCFSKTSIGKQFHGSYYSVRTGRYKVIKFTGTEKQFEFLGEAYKFILKNKNKFCKEINNHSSQGHSIFEAAFVKGFLLENHDFNSNAFIEAYNAGSELRKMFVKAKEEW